MGALPYLPLLGYTDPRRTGRAGGGVTKEIDKDGRRIVAVGTLAEIKSCRQSVTGRYI